MITNHVPCPLIVAYIALAQTLAPPPKKKKQQSSFSLCGLALEAVRLSHPPKSASLSSGRFGLWGLKFGLSLWGSMSLRVVFHYSSELVIVVCRGS